MRHRNIYIDYLKLICTFLVVYIHAGKNSGFLSSVSIVAVPVFFIISGYLYQSVTVRKKKQKEQILKIAKMFCLSFVFYIVWYGIVFPLIKGGAVTTALAEQISVVAMLKLLLLNAPTHGYHLWYLATLVYVLCIETVVDRFIGLHNAQKRTSGNAGKYIEVSVFALLVIGVIIPPICNVLEVPFRIELVRNFLFEGFPMFHIGRLIAGRFANGDVEIKILLTKCNGGCEGINSKQSIKYHPIAIAVAVTIFLLVGLIVERGIFDSINIHASLSVFTVLMSVVFVVWAVMMSTIIRPKVKQDKRQKAGISEILGGGLILVFI